MITTPSELDNRKTAAWPASLTSPSRMTTPAMVWHWTPDRSRSALTSTVGATVGDSKPGIDKTAQTSELLQSILTGSYCTLDFSLYWMCVRIHSDDVTDIHTLIGTTNYSD